MYTTDGKTLVFGEAGTTKTTLTYGIDLQRFKVQIKPVPNNLTFITDDYLHTTEPSNHKVVQKRPKGGAIETQAQKAFQHDSVIYHDSLHHDNLGWKGNTLASRLEEQTKLYTQARETKQVVYTGVTTDLGIRLGQQVVVKDYGVYQIISVTHRSTMLGNYENVFEAIDISQQAVSPFMDLTQTAKSGSQVAMVYDNKDPEGLGRVQVQFPWQKVDNVNTHTPWIRMLQFHAGLDRGNYCIPELGDEVMVQFQGHNAERPYVVGYLYNAPQKPDTQWASKANVKENNIKALRTRSGHTIALDDTEGSEKIEIYDKEGSIIRFDTKNKSLYIYAAENIECIAQNSFKLKAKQIELLAEEQLALESQSSNITLNASETIQQEAKTIQNTASKDISQEAANINIAAKAQLKVVARGKGQITSSMLELGGKGHTLRIV